MNTQKTHLSGMKLGEYTLGEMIGQGAFSWVYKGTSEDNLKTRAFKIAKPMDLVGAVVDEQCPTQALTFRTGGIGPITPDPVQLLALQADKLKSVSDPNLVNLDECVFEDSLSYYSMAVIGGTTLRSHMNAGPLPINIILAVAQAMDRLSNNPKFLYHGDLKPENILVTEGGIKLIDPGYSGPLDCKEGNLSLCLVTTPQYYPLLTAQDDLFALGIILWEAACRKHPLDEGKESCYADLSRIGNDLQNWVRHKELVGQYYLSPILEAGLPSQVRPGIPQAVEKTLMKGLKLWITPDGKIDKGPGYKNFAELIEDLKDLMSLNIRHL